MLSAEPLDDNVLTASGASCSLDSVSLESPIFFFFLSVLATISCDEDDDPVFEASCGSGVLGCLIAEYQSHRLALQSHPPVASDGQHGGLNLIWIAGEGFAAIASEERLGSDRRRRDNVNRGEQREGLSSAYRSKACSSAYSPRYTLATKNVSFIVRSIVFARSAPLL